MAAIVRGAGEGASARPHCEMHSCHVPEGGVSENWLGGARPLLASECRASSSWAGGRLRAADDWQGYSGRARLTQRGGHREVESRSACRDHVIVAAAASRMAGVPAKHLTRYPRQTAIARHGSASCEEDKLHKGLSVDGHGSVIKRATDLASRP